MTKRLRWTRVLLSVLLIAYVNCVLTNLVSLRQRWYANAYNNGTSLTPLHDTLFVDWMEGEKIPFRDTVTLRDMVDVCTYAWVLVTVLAWATCSKAPEVAAKALSAQILLVPVFSLSQLLTIVPDSTPDCLEVYDIPNTADVSWVFWKYPSRACGNMMWSSDVTQLVIFTAMATQLVPDTRRRLRCCVWTLGECWTVVTMVFIFASRYQYSVDVLTTIVVVKLAMSHLFVRQFAVRCFVKRGPYYERAPVRELVMPSL